MKFTMYGIPYGFGKDNIAVTRTGRRFPNKRFQAYKKEAIPSIKAQLRRWHIWTVPLYIEIHYWPGDKRQRDSTAIEDGVYNIAEEMKIVANDSQFKEKYYKEEPLDKACPRIEVEIRPMERQ